MKKAFAVLLCLVVAALPALAAVQDAGNMIQITSGGPGDRITDQHKLSAVLIVSTGGGAGKYVDVIYGTTVGDFVQRIPIALNDTTAAWVPKGKVKAIEVSSLPAQTHVLVFTDD